MSAPWNLLRATNFRDRINTYVRLLVKDMDEMMKFPEIFVQVVKNDSKLVVSDSVLKIEARFNSEQRSLKEIVPGKILLVKRWRFNYQADCSGLEVIIEDFETNNRFSPNIPENLVSFEEDAELAEAYTILKRFGQTVRFNKINRPEKSLEKIVNTLTPQQISEEEEIPLSNDAFSDMPIEEEEVLREPSDADSEDSVQTGFVSVSSSMYLDLVNEEEEKKNCTLMPWEANQYSNIGFSSEKKGINKITQSPRYDEDGITNKSTTVSKYTSAAKGEFSEKKIVYSNDMEIEVGVMEGGDVSFDPAGGQVFGKKRSYHDIFQIVFKEDLSEEEALPVKKGNFLSGKISAEKQRDLIGSKTLS